MQILLIVFNRPDLVSQIWERIRQVKPEKLYIAADGPRNSISEDVNGCKAVRKIVSRVDWNCETHRLFHNENLGCHMSVKTAIDWFFHYETEGIILEDDCLPDLSFFRFSLELLDKYRTNEKIFMLTGTNFIPNINMDASYTFSRLANIWGWASWRRAWKLYDVTMNRWSDYSKSNDLDYFGAYSDDLRFRFNVAYNSESLYNWGIPWRLTGLVHNMLCLVPRVNLIKNLGIGHRYASNHIKPHEAGNIPVHPISFPLEHPNAVNPNQVYDIESRKFVINSRSKSTQ